MEDKRVPLYERLPEIYRIKDDEQQPPGQLRHYLGLVEDVFDDIHKNIEALYHDLFIDTSADWAIPYIGDLLGVSHLEGDPWTLRADVADTIALRRRKGTKGAIELLTYDLTGWGVHVVELRENLVWNHHLNHQRPDDEGAPPYRHELDYKPLAAPRGGTVPVRDPALLSLLHGSHDPLRYENYPSAYDSFAHTADLKPPAQGDIRYNLPNLAIFLWRLIPYKVPFSKPLERGTTASVDGGPAHARFDVHPVGEPVRLFNWRRRFDRDRDPLQVTRLDETPGPMPAARLTEGSPAGNPTAYVSVSEYLSNELPGMQTKNVGLNLHVPPGLPISPDKWRLRGANLCAWELGVHPPLKEGEVAVDPVIGRVLFGVATDAQATSLQKNLLTSYTYGAPGPVGAHPVEATAGSVVPEPATRTVNWHDDKDALKKALDNLDSEPQPVVIEIEDSMTHELDPATLVGTIPDGVGRSILLGNSLTIRAVSGERPVIRLASPLRFRPKNVRSTKSDPAEREKEQAKFDDAMDELTVRLEGLYLTRAEVVVPATAPITLIARAALHRLEIMECTLDPGGYWELAPGGLSSSRADVNVAVNLRDSYGFADADVRKEFKQTPEIVLHQTITGPLQIDENYTLHLTRSILDAGSGVDTLKPDEKLALANATDPDVKWGPSTYVCGITVFGAMRVESLTGRGGIWVRLLKVNNNQKGCVKFSYFSGDSEDRLTQHHACVIGKDLLRFTSEVFGQPGYGQLAAATDFRIRERGPDDDAMGAFGFMMEAHKWRNMQIRFREFMPVGIRPLLIPVT